MDNDPIGFGGVINLKTNGLKAMTYISIMEWKEIDGVEVSTDGQVRSKQGIRKLHTTKKGYKSLTLTIDGKITCRHVHRLMARAFIPNPDNKPEVDHIDRNPANNVVSNLRWVSSAENNQNKSKIASNTSGEPNIYPLFKVQWKRDGKTFQRCFKTIEEAKQCRLQELGF